MHIGSRNELYEFHPAKGGQLVLSHISFNPSTHGIPPRTLFMSQGFRQGLTQSSCFHLGGEVRLHWESTEIGPPNLHWRFSGPLVSTFFWWWKCKCVLGHIWRTTYWVCVFHHSFSVGSPNNGRFNKCIWLKLSSCNDRNVELRLLTLAWCANSVVNCYSFKKKSPTPDLRTCQPCNSYSRSHHSCFLLIYAKQISLKQATIP